MSVLNEGVLMTKSRGIIDGFPKKADRPPSRRQQIEKDLKDSGFVGKSAPSAIKRPGQIAVKRWNSIVYYRLEDVEMRASGNVYLKGSQK